MPTFFDKGACIFLQYGGGGCDPRARTRITPANARRSLARHPPACAKPGNQRLARKSQNGDRATESVIPNHSCKLCSRRLEKLSSWDWEENVEWQVEVTARCRFQRIRRNTEVHSSRRRILDLQAICSPLDRAATIREQVWMSIGDAQPTVTWLLLRRACTLALRWASTRQGAGLSGRQVARPAGWCPRFAREKRHCEERMLLTEVWVAIELFGACRWSQCSNPLELYQIVSPCLMPCSVVSGRTPPPLEAILVIFGRRALIFFCLKALGKKRKMTLLLCACAVVITLETQKCRKRAPRSVEFNFFICSDRRKRFSRNERRRADLQNVASDILIFVFGT